MGKRLAIILLGFFAAVLGNLIAGYVQQDMWSNVFTTERLVITAISLTVMLLFVAMLETERALAWNWRWHCFWYLRELLKNPDLRRWETDFARLEVARGRRKVSSAEVITASKYLDMVDHRRW